MRLFSGKIKTSGGRAEQTKPFFFPLHRAELTEHEMLCKCVPVPEKFRKEGSKISSAGLLPAPLPSHLAALFPGEKMPGKLDCLAYTSLTGGQKFWGLPRLKARAEPAMQPTLAKGKDVFSADSRDSGWFGFPRELGQNQTVKSPNPQRHRIAFLCTDF